MSGRKFVLSSMEDDFRAIGLVQEAKEEDSGDLGEAVKILRRKTGATARKARKLSKKWRRTHKAQVRMQAKRRLRSPKAKRAAKLHAKILKRLGAKKVGLAHKTGRMIRVAGIDRVANLIEDVRGIIGGISSRKDNEIVKGFANVALIADSMAQTFMDTGKEEDIQDLVDLGEAFSEMAENAADTAEGLSENALVVSEELAAKFRAQLEDLLDGLDLYSDLFEEDENEDEDSDLEEEEEDDDEADDEEDDEEEDDSGN